MTSTPWPGERLGEPAPPSGFSHIELSYVTTFYFNQADSSPVLELLRRYASYSGTLLDRLQFVLVDDGSPIPVKLPAELDLNVLLLRIPGGRALEPRGGPEPRRRLRALGQAPAD